MMASNSKASQNISGDPSGSSATDQSVSESKSPSDGTVSDRTGRKTGWVIAINNIKGCEEDVKSLQMIFSTDYNFIVLDCTSRQSILEKMKSMKSHIYGQMVVFFFGYGYDDYLFLGPTDKESFSYKAFCEIFNDVREKGNPTVVFTNTCFKAIASDTITYKSLKIPVADTVQFCVKINGTNESGSLLTKAVLQVFSQIESTGDITTFTSHVNCIIDKLEETDDDNYYIEVRYYGVSMNIKFPQLMIRQEPVDTTRGLAQ